MTFVPAQSNGSASKKGLIFIAPLALLIISILDLTVWWRGHPSTIFWLFSVLTVASCVIGLISTASKYPTKNLLKIAGLLYAVVTFAWNIYLMTTIHEDNFWIRFCLAFGLPLSRVSIDIFSYNFHQTFSNVLNLLYTVSIFLILLISFLPQRQKKAPRTFPVNILPVTPLPLNGVAVTTSPNQIGQWIVKMPGQPDNFVDTPTIQMWARSGVIRPDTIIVEASSGTSYQARQIPNVF